MAKQRSSEMSKAPIHAVELHGMNDLYGWPKAEGGSPWVIVSDSIVRVKETLIEK